MMDLRVTESSSILNFEPFVPLLRINSTIPDFIFQIAFTSLKCLISSSE